MHNNYHSNISRNPFYFTHRLTTEYIARWRTFFRFFCAHELLNKVKGAAFFCLTTVAVSALLLAGVYFFMVQLANNGW